MKKLQYSDFKLFIDENKIKQNALAEYLGVSPAFITQLVQGLRKLPEEKLALILTNNKWNTDMLRPKTAIEQKIINGHNNTQIANDEERSINAAMLAQALDEIAAQRSVNQKSQEQIDRLITLLEKREK